MGELRQREPRYENRKLLDLAHKVDGCTNCRQWVHPGCEPAHENGQEAGKAMSTKSQDNRHAALCHDCHAWYDSGSGQDPTGLWDSDRHSKALMWQRSHMRTFDIYWRNGWIGVL